MLAAPKTTSVFALLFVLTLSVPGYSQTNHPDPKYKLISGGDYVMSKNYYVLTLFRVLPDVKKLFAADATLKSISVAKNEALTNALKNCGKDGYCYTAAIKFSAQEIATVSERLKALYQQDNALGKLVKEHLIPSGSYVLFQNISPADMLVKAWEQDANGINYAIGVYAEGKKPHYPNIDSISYSVREPRDTAVLRAAYVGFVYNVASLISIENKKSTDFFNIPLTAALHFIEVNEREQAADFEPMAEGENKAAYDRVKTIKWDNYKYSLIMIPGAGPDEPNVALSAEGMIRCRLAAIQYQQGVAPFIVTSGGKVHPYKTKYCEATEMKKYLIEKLHIPANAIIIDPHARHTTTNMRNTARLIYRYGIPFNKVALTCTTRGQSTMIEKTLIARCLKELNEAPYKNGERMSETEMEFYPAIDALHINPEEPLDP